MHKWSDDSIKVLLKLYRQHDCLWNTYRTSYTDKAARDAAYVLIQVALCKEIGVELTLADVQAKIKTLRTAYNKEINKILMSEKCGTVYNPKLVWFSQADEFLRGLVEPKKLSTGMMHLKTFAMDTETEDWRVRITGVCRCCLSEEDLRPMMNPPEGTEQNYADMLKETFVITLDRFEKDGVKQTQLICEACVQRLRDASAFKRQVKDAEKTLSARFFQMAQRNVLLPKEETSKKTTENHASNDDRNSVTETTSIETDPLLVKEEMDKTKSEDLNPESEEKSAKPTEKNRLPNFCLFCNKHVTNFMRHIRRRHPEEREVRAILSLPNGSKERKILSSKLRKKGNYVQNALKCVKPMKRNFESTVSYLPCPTCLGFYTRSLLWRHRKLCSKTPSGRFAQSEAQNLLIRHLKIDSELKKYVLPRMMADNTSLVAKRDNLICAFGSEYLKIHKKEKRVVNVVSRKMRELGKLLIESKKLKPDITRLLDALKPEHYDTLVTATKNVAKYDQLTEQYSSPTYAMNISTSIKQCCNIAIKQTLESQEVKKDGDEIKEGVKSLIKLMENNWKLDVSSQAANSFKLNVKKCTIVQLARDLKVLNAHLNHIAETAANNLWQNDHDETAYADLLESVYCRVLLLNRRYHKELQQLLQHTYLDSEDAKDKDEEFNELLTETEIILLQRFKPVFVRKGVPVLFSTDVQKDITILNAIRDEYVDKGNKFLFAKPKSNPICGYNIIEKHAKLCGAKNTKSLSSTSLRRHLATLTQIFAMSKTDLEQLVTFIRQKTGVHMKASDDIYQTAKIAKLMTLIEDGKAESFKGKNLNDIHLNLDEEIAGEPVEVDEILQYISNINPVEPTFEFVPIAVQEDKPCTSASTPVAISTKHLKRTLVPWRDKQKDVVLEYFKTHISEHKPPKRQECDALKEQHKELLENKDWLKIKVFVQNCYTKKLKF